MCRCPAVSRSGASPTPAGSRCSTRPNTPATASPGRGIETGELVDADKGVRLCSIDDPDGNTITLIGNFRERY